MAAAAIISCSPSSVNPDPGQHSHPLQLLRALCHRRELPHHALALWVLMSAHAANPERFCSASQLTLAEELGLSDRHVRRGMTLLEARGFICPALDSRGNRGWRVEVNAVRQETYPGFAHWGARTRFGARSGQETGHPRPGLNRNEHVQQREGPDSPISGLAPRTPVENEPFDQGFGANPHQSADQPLAATPGAKELAPPMSHPGSHLRLVQPASGAQEQQADRALVECVREAIATAYPDSLPPKPGISEKDLIAAYELRQRMTVKELGRLVQWALRDRQNPKPGRTWSGWSTVLRSGGIVALASNLDKLNSAMNEDLERGPSEEEIARKNREALAREHQARMAERAAIAADRARTDASPSAEILALRAAMREKLQCFPIRPS